MQGARAADRVFEQLERHHIADAKAVKPRALLEIGPVKVDFAVLGQADVAVALPDEESGDATIGGPAAEVVGSGW